MTSTMAQQQNITLAIINGPNAGEKMGASAPTAESMEPTVSIGRSSESDFSVMDVRMSRRHMQLFFHHDQWVVRDLDSSNGTLVNGERVQQIALSDGDRITVGDTIFQVALSDGETDRFIATENACEDHESRIRATWRKN